MVFGDELSNGVIYIYPRPTSVAMATKFGTKRNVRNFGDNSVSITYVSQIFSLNCVFVAFFIDVIK